MKFRYDPQSGALYIRLREGQIHKSLELAEGAYLNIDIEGQVLGAVFLSLEEFAEFASRQGKGGRRTARPPGGSGLVPAGPDLAPARTIPKGSVGILLNFGTACVLLAGDVEKEVASRC